jgi:hypothetical protein
MRKPISSFTRVAEFFTNTLLQRGGRAELTSSTALAVFETAKRTAKAVARDATGESTALKRDVNERLLKRG